MKRLLFLSISLGLFAQNAQARVTLFDRLFGNTDRSQNEVVTADDNMEDNQTARVVIDRNPAVQQMKIYRPGDQTPSMTCDISTGRESFDMPTNFKRNASCSDTPTNKSGEPFKVQRLVRRHFSDTWRHKDEVTGEMVGSEMPYSTFFNGGVAIHVASSEGLKTLGPKVEGGKQEAGGSGGCVRATEECAKTVFDLFATQTVKNGKKEYVPIDVNKFPECRQPTAPPRCTEKDQMYIQYNRQPAAIEVVDTRTPEEQQAVVDLCLKYKAMYNDEKFNCLLAKKTEAGEPVDATLEAEMRADRKKMIGFLNSNANTKKNEECNKDIYYAKLTAKCHVREINRYTPPEKRTMKINQGMFNMDEVAALRTTVKTSLMEKIEQQCAAEIQSLMFVSPSDPEPRPTGAVPPPMPRTRPAGL